MLHYWFASKESDVGLEVEARSACCAPGILEKGSCAHVQPPGDHMVKDIFMLSSSLANSDLDC